MAAVSSPAPTGWRDRRPPRGTAPHRPVSAILARIGIPDPDQWEALDTAVAAVAGQLGHPLTVQSCRHGRLVITVPADALAFVRYDTDAITDALRAAGWDGPVQLIAAHP